jgi:hypothetical protein
MFKPRPSRCRVAVVAVYGSRKTWRTGWFALPPVFQTPIVAKLARIDFLRLPLFASSLLRDHFLFYASGFTTIPHLTWTVYSDLQQWTHGNSLFLSIIFFSAWLTSAFCIIVPFFLTRSIVMATDTNSMASVSVGHVLGIAIKRVWNQGLLKTWANPRNFFLTRTRFPL